MPLIVGLSIVRQSGLSIIIALWLCPYIIAAATTPAQSTSPSAPASTATAQPPDADQVRRLREMVMKPVVYSVPGMDKVKVIRDLDYTGEKSQYRKMDVYVPPGVGPGERRPAVIFIHGGAAEEYTPKDWGIYTSWGKLVAASGLVAVTFTHRLGFPQTRLEEGASDVDRAINYVRDHAELNVDPDRLALIAFSAGGPLLSEALREKPPYVRCLLAFYAFMDIQQSDVHRRSEAPETIKKFSNINYLSAPDAGKIPPMLIARAGRDEVPTMNDSIDRFVSAALSANIAVTILNHPDGPHGFDNRQSDDRSREIIRAAVEFMKCHLSG